jgi:hypothetical protein
MVWHRWSVAARIICLRLAERDVTVTPSRTLITLAIQRLVRVVCFSSIGFSYQNEWELWICITSCNPSEKSAKNDKHLIEVIRNRWTSKVKRDILISLSCLLIRRKKQWWKPPKGSLNSYFYVKGVRSGSQCWLARLAQSYRREPYRNQWVLVSYFYTL